MGDLLAAMHESMKKLVDDGLWNEDPFEYDDSDDPIKGCDWTFDEEKAGAWQSSFPFTHIQIHNGDVDIEIHEQHREWALPMVRALLVALETP